MRDPFLSTAMAEAYEGLAPVPATFLLDNVRSLFNVGSFFRTADGAGMAELVLTGITGFPPQREIEKTSLGAEKTVPWRQNWDAVAMLTGQRFAGHQIAAIETAADAVDLFDWEPRWPLTVIFGHETEGIRPELLRYADVNIRIPMLGMKHSLNVASAGAVVAYELLRKWRIRM